MTRLLTLAALVACLLSPLGAAAQVPSVAVPADAAAVPAAGTAPLDTLIEALRDDAAREALIAELERARDAAAGDAEADPVAETPTPAASLGGRIAEATRAFAERGASALAALPSSLRSARTLLRGLDAETWEAIFNAVLNLAAVIAVTAGVFVALRLAAIPVLRRIGAATRNAGVVRKAAGLVASAVIRVLTVVLAWAIGYGAMLIAIGEFGSIGFNQTLFLNAFLVVELLKAAVRTVVSPAADDLRPLPMSDRAARTLTRNANIAISVLGYGLLLVVPIIDQTEGFLATRAMSVLVIELAVLYLAVAVLRHAHPVGDWLVARTLAPPPMPGDAEVRPAEEVGEAETVAGDRTAPPRESFLAALLRHWHWFALGWLAYVGFRALTQSTAGVGGIVLSTLEVAAVAFVGGALITALGRRIRAGVIVPEALKIKLPALERRLNGVVPRLLMLLRALVALIVVLFALDQIGLTDVTGWLGTDAGLRFLGTLATVVAILAVAWGIWLAVASWVDYRLNPEYGMPPSSREITLLTLLRNAVTVAVLVFALMFTLSEIGLNIGPLIASAGVIGLAIGFGAQKLVQDIITGVFIQFENAINVGDVVTVGGTTGGVERLTVRSVTLRDLQGVVHIVPFSSVDMVSNYTREFSFYVVDMGVAYREDIDEAKQAMFDAFDLLRQDPEQGAFILGDLEYFGVDAFGDNAVVLKARVKTWPGKQWGVGRAYNRYLKKVFDERGIEIPFPHRTIYLGEAKDGHIQELPIRQVGGPSGSAAPGPRGDHEGRGAPTDDGPLGDGEP